ncbi:DUF6804 family protein [Agrobacterium tumefaciens]|uniref:DUF6804 family protein n=1 Tax=Agrobacterium tumefaciens TaxID=358 RepID=UPI003BA22D6B
MTTFPGHIILVPAVALVIAVLPLPYGYYTLLRLGITAFAAFFAYIGARRVHGVGLRLHLRGIAVQPVYPRAFQPVVVVHP